ncbi:sensor histidine kinase [Burkholderia sp. 3C]
MILRKSVLRRFLLLSIAAAVVPVLGIGFLYDRLTNTAFERMLGERVSAHFTATVSRLATFMENRRYQAETIANYPGIGAIARDGQRRPPPDIAALLQVEADQPDLYGILFFRGDGHLTRVIPGQAASGRAYWGERPFEIAALPVARLGEAEILGPVAPQGNESGWFLLKQSIPNSADSAGRLSFVALHVRLASLGEQLGATPAIGALRPLLRTPAGDIDNVGRVVVAHQKLLDGPDFIAGWKPLLEVEPGEVVGSLESERRALLLAVFVGVVAMVWFYLALSGRMRTRIKPLLSATTAISSGRWGHRIPEDGDDEITAVSRALNTMSGKLQQTLDEAVQMERLAVLGEFATRIAHEVRNPLASLKTTSQALGRREADAKRRALLEDMESEIDRLAGVVSDLVDFGRPRAPQRTYVDAGELFHKVVQLTQSTADRKAVHLTCLGASKLLFFIDRDQIIQVLVNLVLNAVEATGAQGAVLLRASRSDHAISIEICDTGIGIPEDIRKRVTEPFFTTKSRGVGLGLSIARQLVELNGGDMSIDSQAGQGTSVMLSFSVTHRAEP